MIVISSLVLVSYTTDAILKFSQNYVGRRVDNAIHQINHYPVNSGYILLTLVHWIVMDSVIQPSDNWSQVWPSL